MRTPTGDRQIISILAALVIHTIIVLMLGLVDLGQDIDEQRLGPVAVRFEPVPPEALPQPTEPPEPEEPRTEPSEPPAEPEEPAAAPQQQESPPRQAAAQAQPERAAEEEWSIPTPSGSEIQETERRRAPREPSSEQPPASQSLEGRTADRVAPEQQQGSSEGSRIDFAEEEPPESRETDRRQPDTGRTAEDSQAGSRSVFDEDMMEELESVQASEEGSSNGTAQGGDGSASGTSSVRTEEGGDIVYALEGENTARKLERSSLPKLSPEELEGLPGRVEVVVSFTLLSNGRTMDLNIERSSSSIPIVDARVKEAVQTWEFSDAPQEAEPVRGMARIIIRTAD